MGVHCYKSVPVLIWPRYDLDRPTTDKQNKRPGRFFYIPRICTWEYLGGNNGVSAHIWPHICDIQNVICGMTFASKDTLIDNWHFHQKTGMIFSLPQSGTWGPWKHKNHHPKISKTPIKNKTDTLNSLSHSSKMSKWVGECDFFWPTWWNKFWVCWYLLWVW